MKTTIPDPQAVGSNALNDSMKEKPEARIDPFFASVFRAVRRRTASGNPGCKIRNAAVVHSALREFSQRGLIMLVKAADGIPSWLPAGKAKLVKAKGGQPIWMPTQKLLQDWIEISTLLWPALRDGSLFWSLRTAKFDLVTPPTA